MVTLNKPSAGDTDWTTEINDNWTTIETAIEGAAKAWVHFNGTGTVTINDSLNVSSVTDRGTGLYTINFTTAFANSNYAGVTFNHHADGNVPVDISWDGTNATWSTTAWSICLEQGTAHLDLSKVSAAFFGDQ